jgi:hypothetical protein
MRGLHWTQSCRPGLHWKPQLDAGANVWLVSDPHPAGASRRGHR